MSSIIDINKIVWKSEYNIGNLKIDTEHQNLFLLARKALSLTQKKSKDEENKLKIIVKELYEYVGTHFNHEENFMEEIAYPDIEHHKQIHHNILTMLNKLISELNTLEIEVIEKKLCEFIEEYFINHIITEDKKIHLWNTPLDELRKAFGWKDIYSVRDERIDDEHKKLFDIAQEAFNVVDDEKRSYKIKEILTNLYEYMKKHFKHEEDYMESINYPQLEEHKQLHKKIIKNINEFVTLLPTMDIELFEKELAKLIDISLVQHIIQEDRQIINFLNSQ